MVVGIATAAAMAVTAAATTAVPAIAHTLKYETAAPHAGR